MSRLTLLLFPWLLGACQNPAVGNAVLAMRDSYRYSRSVPAYQPQPLEMPRRAQRTPPPAGYSITQDPIHRGTYYLMRQY